MIRQKVFVERNTTRLLHMYQVFVFMLSCLQFFVHFFLTFLETPFKKQTIPSKNYSINSIVAWSFFFLISIFDSIVPFCLWMLLKNVFLFMKIPCCKFLFWFLTRQKKGDRRHQTGTGNHSTSFKFIRKDY